MKPTASNILRRLAAAGLKPPRTVTLAVTNRCNLSCRHCWPDSGPEAEGSEVAAPVLLGLIDGFADMGAERLVITGGEPLTHADWFDLLSFACGRAGIREVRLQTNAILITPANADRLLSLKEQGLIIQTSLEGASPPPHDRVRGAGSFEGAMAGLRRLVEGGMAERICITFTEMRHNFEEIPGLLNLADDMGVGQFVTGTLVHGGRAAKPGGLAPPTPAQVNTLLTRYLEDAAFRERYHRIGNIAALEWFRAPPNDADTCCTFIETPYVTAEGKLFPCVMLHADEFAAAGIHDRSLTIAISEKIDIWAGLQRISRSRLTRLLACKGCPDYARCGAGCMGRAFSAHGALLAPEDRCRLRKTVYHRRRAEE